SDHRLTVTAVLPNGHQTTRFVYEVSTTAGSDLNSNDVLAAVWYPDKTTGDPSATEKESITVNTLGEEKTHTDRNGTVHAYTRDVLGRLTSDAVTTLGAGVDDAVRRLETAYDTAGLPYLYTSFDAPAGGTVVNQVLQIYNGLGQMTAEFQSHGGS